MLVLAQPWDRQPISVTQPLRARLQLINPADNVVVGQAGPVPATSNALTPAVGREGLALRATSANVRAVYPAAMSIGTGDYTMFLYYRLNTALASSYHYAFGTNLTYLAFAARHMNVGFNAGMNDGTVRDSGIAASAPGEYRIVVRRVNGVLRFRINGQRSDVAASANHAAITSLVLNSYQPATTYGLADVHYYLAGMDLGAWSEGEVDAFIDNPWSLFEDGTTVIFTSGSAATALAGDAAAQASATGDLSTGIPIVGAALAVSTGAATLSTVIPLAGAAAATSVASGQLVTSITLSGQALAQAVASAALSSGIILTADAVATAAAQGTLATAIQMIGAATAQASASGSLDAGASLAGNAQAQATAAASLTVQIQLSAQAIAQAAAAAGLTTAIPLGGAATGQASASATLTAPGGPAQLAGAAAATATAGAVLTTGIPLTAEAVAAAIAAGSLTAEIRLSGQATADAYGNAALWTQIHIAGQAVALATATASLDTTASHWADGPVWMLSSVVPLTLYQVAAAPVATWSPAVDVLAQYSAGVHLVQ